MLSLRSRWNSAIFPDLKAVNDNRTGILIFPDGNDTKEVSILYPNLSAHLQVITVLSVKLKFLKRGNLNYT